MRKLSKLKVLAIIFRIAGYVNCFVAILAMASMAADYDDWEAFVKQKIICFTILLITGFLAVFFSSLSEALKKEVKKSRKKTKSTSEPKKLILYDLYDLKKTEQGENS